MPRLASTARLLASAALALAAARAEGPEPLEKLLARADAAYAGRDQPGRLDEARALLDEAEKRTPGDFEILWRRARLLLWLSEDLALPAGEKSRLGKECWDLAEKAAAARPGAVQGWYFAAACIGNYSLGIGILRALAKGLEGKFKDRLKRSGAIDPDYQNGGIETAWGRLWYELPWPKYDGVKSERALRAALRKNRQNVRAKVYLAELYLKEDHPKEARALLVEAAGHEPGAYDAPEERRWKARAAEILRQQGQKE